MDTELTRISNIDRKTEIKNTHDEIVTAVARGI